MFNELWNDDKQFTDVTDQIVENVSNVYKETRNGFKMDHYSKLLGDAIKSIITVKDQSDLDSLLDGSQTELFTKEITGLEDFELIDFLVIR